jgi:hypothetical protein
MGFNGEPGPMPDEETPPTRSEDRIRASGAFPDAADASGEPYRG